ncbi:MAG TPA: HAMP domain-containing sensor histidine kinase [Streptosporangiaceae bacterium]
MNRQHGGPPLRHRVLVSIMTVTVFAVVLFTLPLGIAVQRLYRSEAVTALQRDAARAAAVVPDTIPGRGLSVPSRPSSFRTLGVYDTAGRRVAGSGPGRSVLAANGAKAQVRDAVEGVDLAVIAPIPSDQKAVGTVRAAVPYSIVTDRVHQAWAAMGLLAFLAVALAAVLARRQAVRLAAPLERLTLVARALGDGDFTVRAERFGVREADTASQALEDTATQLGQLLQRERAFSSDVSHQLRTPLTALTVGLESALSRPDADLRAALGDALSRSDHLRSTVEELLSLIRRPGHAAQPIDLTALIDDVRARWHGPLAAHARRLVMRAEPDLPRCLAPAAAVRQIVDVLVGNALGHGAGTVTVDVHDVGSGAAIDVADEGPGLAGDPDELLAGSAERADGHGRGLPLARALADAAGGRLVVRRAAPGPVFSLLLPAAPDDPGDDQPAGPGS